MSSSKKNIDNLLFEMTDYVYHTKIEDYLNSNTSKQDECPIARDLLSKNHFYSRHHVGVN